MRGTTVPSELNKFHVLITSYEVFLLDFNDVILNVPFQFVVVDEAHRLKNKNAKILSALKRMPCKRVLLELRFRTIQVNFGVCLIISILRSLLVMMISKDPLVICHQTSK